MFQALYFTRNTWVSCLQRPWALDSCLETSFEEPYWKRTQQLIASRPVIGLWGRQSHLTMLPRGFQRINLQFYTIHCREVLVRRPPHSSSTRRALQSLKCPLYNLGISSSAVLAAGLRFLILLLVRRHEMSLNLPHSLRCIHPLQQKLSRTS